MLPHIQSSLITQYAKIKLCKRKPIKTSLQKRYTSEARTPMIHCVLVQPQIPHNTGSIGRTCLGFGARLHIVGPTGFSLDDTAVKRAGLDYWPHVDLKIYEDWESFEKSDYQALKKNAYFLTKFGDKSLLDVQFVHPNLENSNGNMDVALFFGSETKGLHKLVPEKIIESHPLVYMPMVDKGHRKFDTPSFNLATSVSMAMWEAFKQIKRS